MATTSFEYFMGRQNAACVNLLERNHDVSAFVQGIIEHVITFAQREGIDVADVRLHKPFVSMDGQIRGQLSR